MTKATPTVEALRIAEEKFLFLATNPVTIMPSELHATAESALVDIRTALPIAEREAEVKAMLVEALADLVADCETLELEDEIEAGENGNGSMVKARKALKAATGGAE